MREVYRRTAARAAPGAPYNRACVRGRKGRAGVAARLIVAAVVVAVPAAAWLAQERLVFFPQPMVGTAHLPAGAQALEMPHGDGTRLAGIFVPASAPRAPVVLFFGGNAEEISWTLADARWPRDWSIRRDQLSRLRRERGIGPAEAALVADALAIHRRDRGPTPTSTRGGSSPFGRSLGARGGGESSPPARPPRRP